MSHFNATIISGEYIQSASISIYDVSGQIVLSKESTIEKGENKIYFNEFSFAKGAYIMHIITEGVVFKPIRFIIN